MTEEVGVPLRCCWGGGVIGARGQWRACGPAGAALPWKEGSGDGIDYDDEDGGRRHKRGGVDDDGKRLERSFHDAMRRRRRRRWRRGCHAESIILSAPPAESMMLSAQADSIILSAPSLNPSNSHSVADFIPLNIVIHM
jgi:hypothetical protein